MPVGRPARAVYARLRSDCPYAECRKIWLDGGHIDARPDLTLDGVEALGYGVRFLFGGGHARGIYPWPQLGDLA